MLPELWTANQAATWEAEVEGYQKEAAKDSAHLRLTLLVAGAVVCFLVGLIVGQLRETTPKLEAPTEETYPADVPRGLSGAHSIYSI